MSPDERRAALDAQIERLATRNPRMAEALRSLEPGDAGAIEIETGPRGIETLSVGGQRIGSSYDPVREAERLIDASQAEGADLVVALGFGNGQQLDALRRRHRCRVVVFEPSLARLRAGLAIRPDLDWCDDSEIWWTDDLDELRILLQQLYTPGLRVEVLVHPVVHRLDPEPLREAVSRIARLKDSVDILGRTRSKMMSEWSEGTAGNAKQFLRSPPFSILEGRFAGKPAVVCAAGPSLTRQLETLRRHRDRLVVIGIGQSLKALRAAGIEPDFVHVVESGPVAHQLEAAGANDELTLVLPPQAHGDLFRIPVGRRLTVYPTSNPLAVWLAGALGETRFPGTGGTVAQCAVHLAFELGASPVLLIGQDLAFTDGEVYAKGSAYEAVGVKVTEDGYEFTGMREKMTLFGEPDSTTRFGGDLIMVEGWDGKPVATNVTYATFRDYYRDMAGYLADRGCELINCTEGGARIPGVAHRPFAEACAEYAREETGFAAELDAAWSLIEEVPAEALRAALDDARTALARIESLATKGIEAVERASRRSGGDARRTVKALSRIVSRQRAIAAELEGLPFLEAFAQQELHRLGALSRRADALDATPEQARDEATLLFRASRDAIGPAREVVEALAAALPDSVLQRSKN